MINTENDGLLKTFQAVRSKVLEKDVSDQGLDLYIGSKAQKTSITFSKACPCRFRDSFVASPLNVPNMCGRETCTRI